MEERTRRKCSMKLAGDEGREDRNVVTTAEEGRAGRVDESI